MRSPPGLHVLVAVLALLAIPLASCTDASALTLDRMVVTQAGDSLMVRVPLRVPAGADSARITLTVTPGGMASATAQPQAVALVFTVPGPAEGATVTLRACGVAYRHGVAGPSSCNAQQSYTRPINPPGPITWPDTMTISQMTFPDSASLALMEQAEADAIPAATVGIPWVRWAGALWVRGDRGVHSWQEVREQAVRFALSPRHRMWWDSTKACGCDVYLAPPLPYPPGYKA